MPFTFSHPAIILPFISKKKYFSVSGLVIGSMIPDFEYFIRMKVIAEYGHNLLGVFWFDLPLSILFLFIFHNTVRNRLIDNLPKFFNTRFFKYKSLNWNSCFKENWVKISLSIIIGTLSHLLWDGFTHYNGYFVDSIPFLKNNINILITTVPTYNILQHFSTFLGGFAILFFIYRIPQNELNYHNRINLFYWGAIILFTAVIMYLRFINGFCFKYYGNIIVSLISAFLLSLILVSFILSSTKN